jgi:hypothetical protein
MTTPVRIQRRRTKGFDLQAASRAVNGLPARCIDRSTWWGNPFRVGTTVSVRSAKGERIVIAGPIENDAEAIAWFRGMWLAREARSPGLLERRMAELRGKNLACFCPLGSPCHGDVLLELANRPIRCEAAE